MTDLMPKASKATIFVNARLIDPESKTDAEGSLIIADGLIAEVIIGEIYPSGTKDLKVIDCEGHALMPGLIDLRTRTGEPGFEPRETLKSAGLAAAAGGVTSMVVLPDTHPCIDEPAMVDFINRRARDNDLVKIYPAGAATRGLEGEKMAEIGLMSDAGAVYFTNADEVITNTKVLDRVLKYAKGFGAKIAHRPNDKWLSQGTCATSGEIAQRMGLAYVSPLAEHIGLMRDVTLAKAAKVSFMADMISTEGSLRLIEQVKKDCATIKASVSINHLCFNELDIGDYRTFFRLDPPLRSEQDRLALIEGVASGIIDFIVSDHCPRPAEDKRLPFSEAAPGAIGLQTLLLALIGLSLDYEIDLVDILACVTHKPADWLGLSQGRLKAGAPADLILVDLCAPSVFRESDILSKSKNAPFENRLLTGKVLLTVVDGVRLYEREF